jgi:hypothetical protein
VANQHVGPPVHPLEEVVRVARVSPETNPAYRAARRGVGSKLRQLAVGQRFAADGEQPDRRAGDGPAVEGPGPHGGGERHDEERRDHSLAKIEKEEIARGGSPPVFAKGAVTTVFAVGGQHAVAYEIDAEAHRPRGREAGHERPTHRITGREDARGDRATGHEDGPSDIGGRGVARTELERPQGHQHSDPDGDEHHDPVGHAAAAATGRGGAGTAGTASGAATCATGLANNSCAVPTARSRKPPSQ